MPVPKLPLYMTGLLYPYHRAWWRRTLRRRSILTDWHVQHRAILIHIPKTAGTSILSALKAPPIFDTHAPLSAWADAYPEHYRSAYRFTFVRNPWDRFASAFHFMKSGTDWPMQQEWARRHIGDLSFRDFIHKLENPVFRANVMAERFFWPQSFWLDKGRGEQGVDDIFRFEALDEAIVSLHDRFGLPRPAATPHLRGSGRSDYRTLYDDRTAEIVGRIYRRDVAMLNYDFASPACHHKGT